jgi:hypothetical protein
MSTDIKSDGEMTTYRMADGSQVYGEYSFVTDLEFFDESDEPVELVKETWILRFREHVRYHSPLCQSFLEDDE